METEKTIESLRGLPEAETEQVAAEANQLVAQQQPSVKSAPNTSQPLPLAGPVMPNEQDMPDATDWSNDHLPKSLLSPEDENNVRRIWKSPGGC